MFAHFQHDTIYIRQQLEVLVNSTENSDKVEYLIQLLTSSKTAVNNCIIENSKSIFVNWNSQQNEPALCAQLIDNFVTSRTIVSS